MVGGPLSTRSGYDTGPTLYTIGPLLLKFGLNYMGNKRQLDSFFHGIIVNIYRFHSSMTRLQ